MVYTCIGDLVKDKTNYVVVTGVPDDDIGWVHKLGHDPSEKPWPTNPRDFLGLTEIEREIVQEVYHDEIRAIRDRLGCLRPDIQPTGKYKPLADEADFAFNTGYLDPEVANKIGVGPVGLEVQVMDTISSAPYGPDPGSDAGEKEIFLGKLQRAGYKNLIRLARLAGFNGLFQVTMRDFRLSGVYRGLHDIIHGSAQYRDGTATFEGVAYILNLGGPSFGR